MRLSSDAKTQLQVARQRAEERLASQEALLSKAAKAKEVWVARRELQEEQVMSLRQKAREVGSEDRDIVEISCD